MLEIASDSTVNNDRTWKRQTYAEIGVREYWRFDYQEDRPHNAPLAGDRPVDGVYEPIPIEQLEDRLYRGYSAVLDLYLRWNYGQLEWIDPRTGQHIIRFQDERAGRIQAEEHADREQAARVQAESHNRELEAEVERLRKILDMGHP